MGNNERQWRSLGKMYNRLDGIAKTACLIDNDLSDNKFNSLKTRYQQEHGKLMGANPVKCLSFIKYSNLGGCRGQ